MARLPDSRGFVLPLVAVLLFSLMLLFSLLLKTTGKMNPVLLRHKTDFENFYKAESAVLLHLQGFPAGYYAELPRVQTEAFGPWEKICTVRGDSAFVTESITSEDSLCLLAGTEPHSVSFGVWASGIYNYRSTLEKQILEKGQDKTLYGNRRFFQGDSLMVGVIRDGDLEVDFSDGVSNASFWVGGTALFRGQAHFDTLRLYALGDVVLRGDVSIDYVELFTQGHFRAEGKVKFSGVVVASSFQIQEDAQGIFPAVVLAHGTGIPWGEITGKSVVTGAAEAPGGLLGVEYPENVKRTVFPAFIEGPRKVWGRL